MKTDDASADFFARLAYMSSLLAPGVDTDAAPAFDKLPPSEQQRFRAMALAEIESLDEPAANRNGA